MARWNNEKLARKKSREETVKAEKEEVEEFFVFSEFIVARANVVIAVI